MPANCRLSINQEAKMQKRVVITGMGCISPLGNDPDILWKNILDGKSGVHHITHYDTTDFKCKIAAEVLDFDGIALFGSREVRRMDRFTQFAVAAASQALQNSNININDDNRDQIGVIIGTGIGGLQTIYDQVQVFMERGPSRVSPFLVPMMLPDTAAGMVAIHLGVRGPNLAVISACATGTNALGEAAEIIRRDQAEVILAGGSESVIVPIAMAGLSVMGALSERNDDPPRASRPFDLHRDGFVMGEGAGVLVLEEREHAINRGAKIYAELIGYGLNSDAYHITSPAPNGEGAAKCMGYALKDAGIRPDEVDYINAHGTSTKYGDELETSAIKNVFGIHAYKLCVSSTKSMIGHLLGASGGVEAGFCALSIYNRIVPPTINLDNPDPACDLDYVPHKARPLDINIAMSNSFGFGGTNACIIFKKFS
jgi:3-oxoacyl-[acyl-carrier-protein] synthase II